MELKLNNTSKSLLDDLDAINRYYISIKDEYIQMIDGKSIDSILVTTCTSLCDVPFAKLDCVYVAPSNIEGFGVFAKRNLKRGEIVTIYPSDIVRLPGKDNLYYEFSSERKCIFDEKYAYQTNYCIIAGDLSNIDDMNLVGHIVNDGTICTKNNYNTKNNNCIYYPYHMFVLIVVDKDIKKGEELLVSYGIDYWKIINQ